MDDFDVTFDFHFDQPRSSRPDADADSPTLRRYHELLWTKPLRSGVVFAPRAPRARRDGYLIHTDSDGSQHWFGSDSITQSFTNWSSPRALVEAKAGLTDEQMARYLNPAYTIGGSMIWPVRSAARPTLNQARGFGPTGRIIGDRIDLTLECIRQHYLAQTDNPLSSVLAAYADFFARFENFGEFVEFFHFQPLVSPDLDAVEFLLPFDDFKRPATPTTTAEYVTYSEKSLAFLSGRQQLMANWVATHKVDEWRVITDN